MLPLLAGMIMAWFYFGMLWITIRQLPGTRNPGMLALGAYIFRMGFILAGFYFVSDGRWERILVCLGGFILMRKILVRKWGLRAKIPHSN
jgi:F1F0 ATPase subunit 2